MNRLSEFQVRNLIAVAEEMNNRARELIPGLTGDIFKAAPEGNESYYAISAASIEPKIGMKIKKEFNAKIDKALLFVNPFRELVAVATSLLLWEARGAFLVNNEKPKILKNKTKSPIYIDGAALYAEPAFMNMISSFVEIEFAMVLGKVDIILGGEARGIPFASWIANNLSIATGIVRKIIKDYGTSQGVDGGILRGDEVVIFEDLITDGRSKGPFITNVRNAGAKVVAVFVVFDRKQGGEEFLREEFGVDLISLTDIDTHLKVGLEYGYITAEEERSIQEYLKDPKKWNLDRNYGWPING